MNDLSVAILAGGKSTRFGTSKADACLDNCTLLEIAVKTASEISDDVMVISGYSSKLRGNSINSHMDLIPDCGPIGGLFTALHFTRRPFLASLPCDMPLMSATIYQILRHAASPERPAVALSEQGMEPLLAIWPVRLSLPCLKHSITLGKYSLFRTLNFLNAAEVNISQVFEHYHPDLFCNINYQEDLLRLQNRREEIHVR